MARSSSQDASDSDQITTDTPAGTELKITYRGRRNHQPLTAYLTRVIDDKPDDVEGESRRVIAAHPDSQPAQFLQFTITPTGPTSLKARLTAPDYLGSIEDITLTGEVNEDYAAFEEFYASQEGDEVRLDEGVYTVIEDGTAHHRHLGDAAGDREIVGAKADGLTYSHRAVYEDDSVGVFERTGDRNVDAEAAEVYSEVTDTSDGEGGVVQAIVVDETTYEVVDREDAENRLIRLTDGEGPGALHEHNALLRCDALGLELITGLRFEEERRRVSSEDVSLVREG